MRISFQRQSGNPLLGIAFFWKMAIEVDASVTVVDSFIPELYYDYLFVQKGEVRVQDATQGMERPLPRQALKTIQTQRLMLAYAAPLVLLGARLTLDFAELFWEQALPSDALLPQRWIDDAGTDLAGFAAQVSRMVEGRRRHRATRRFLLPSGEEAAWLADFSPRHRRRLHKQVFGISRQEMRAIQNVHAFLRQTCDFSTPNPRIIEHIDDEHFYDQPHLNRAFKKMTGLSPLEYFQVSSLLQDNLMAASYN